MALAYYPEDGSGQRELLLARALAPWPEDQLCPKMAASPKVPLGDEMTVCQA